LKKTKTLQLAPYLMAQADMELHPHAPSQLLPALISAISLLTLTPFSHWLQAGFKPSSRNLDL